MSSLLRPLLDIRSEERLSALLLGSAYFFLLMTHYLLKPARDALFLVGASANQLPWVYLLTALLTAPLVGLYMRASRSFTIRQTLYGTWIGLAVQLVLMRFLLGLGHPWVYYLFYAWVGVFGAVTVSQFWLLAGTHFDAGQSKRIFPHLGTFGILGAAFGGELTGMLVGDLEVPTQDLLWISLVLLSVTLILFANVGGKRSGDPASALPSEETGDGGPFGALRLLLRTPHLVATVGIIGSTVVATTLVDFQFKTLAAASRTDTAALTGFLATFYGRVSVISLLIQMLSPLFVKRLGATGILVLLPVVLLGGTAGLLVFPGLLAATLVQGSVLSLEYSLDRTGRELLFLPVPSEIKRRTKLFIDVFVDRTFRGIAGLLLLVLTALLGFGAWQIAWVVLGVLVGWLALVVRMRPQYVDAFRRALARRELDLDTGLATHDPTALGTLVSELEAEDPRRVSYAISALGSFAPRELEPFGLPAGLCPLAARQEPEIRSSALSLLASHWPDYPELDVSEAVRAPEPVVRAAGVHLMLAATPEDERQAQFGEMLRSADESIVVAALDTYEKYGSSLGLSLRYADAEAHLDSPPAVKAALAGALGRSTDPAFDPIFETMLASRDRSTWPALTEAAGRRRRPEHVPWLLARLGRGELRPLARRALAAYGEPVIDTLALAMRDLSLPLEVRVQIPRVLERIDSDESIRVLLDEVVSAGSPVADACIASADRLRKRCPWRKADESDVHGALLRIGREQFAADRSTRALRSSEDDPALSLLRQAARERRDLAGAQLFSILGLLERRRDIEGAYRALTSRSRTDRANAREFLMETLRGESRRVIECAIADRSGERNEKGQELYGLRIDTPEDAVRYYLRSGRPWLRACAIWAAARIAPDVHRKRFLEAEADESPLVRETARLALGRRAVSSEI
ncbi:MAG: hypothetical protein H6682_06485 [Candidatus Eisenbacteria bacterium]|nr:hypothetical protein [Candidatus Eisenbacteria bacterium]